MKTVMTILASFFLLMSGAQAQMVEKKFFASSTKTTPASAREDMYDQAVRNASLNFIKGEIGEKSYADNKSVVNEKIIKNYARYIPFIKASDIKGEPGQFTMTVELKISPDDLRTIIKENNLIKTTGDLPLMVPMVKFSDGGEDEVYSWWTEQFKKPSNVLKQLESGLEDALSESMKAAHFYSIKPDALGLKPLVPQAFRVENPRIDDSVSLANYFKGKLLLSGEVEIHKHPKDNKAAELVVRWQGINTANSRSVADLNRSFKITDFKNRADLMQKVAEHLVELSKDFAGQVELGWQRGTLDTNTVKLIIAGRLPLNEYANFKKAVMQKSDAVKEVKERLLAQDQTVFEADVTGSSEALAKQLSGLQLPDQKLRLSKVDHENSALTFEMTQ